MMIKGSSLGFSIRYQIGGISGLFSGDSGKFQDKEPK